MDQSAQRRYLDQAERHVVSGERCVARQLQLIDELRRDGHDVTRARALLLLFEDVQALHVASRDRLRQELG